MTQIVVDAADWTGRRYYTTHTIAPPKWLRDRWRLGKFPFKWIMPLWFIEWGYLPMSDRRGFSWGFGLMPRHKVKKGDVIFKWYATYPRRDLNEVCTIRKH